MKRIFWPNVSKWTGVGYIGWTISAKGPSPLHRIFCEARIEEIPQKYTRTIDDFILDMRSIFSFGSKLVISESIGINSEVYSKILNTLKGICI